MPNIIKKEATPAPTTMWDPFQEMRSLLSWDPFRTGLVPSVENKFMPAFEVKETKDGYLFKADLPGVKEADLDVNVSGDRLVVSGKRDSERTEQNETVYTYERSYGSFQRAFTLPQGIDANAAHAELKEGVLTILLPRSPEAQAKKIAVKSSEKPKI